MATLAVDGSNSFKVAKFYGLKSTPVESYVQANSNASLVGAPQVWSAGKVAEAGADPTEIIGIAQEPGDNDTAGANMLVALALPGVVFSGHLANGNDLTTEYTTVQSDVGSVYGIKQDATNKGWFIDQDETTNVRVRIVGAQDPIGTANGRMYFVFLSYMDIDGTQKSVSGIYGTAT